MKKGFLSHPYLSSSLCAQGTHQNVPEPQWKSGPTSLCGHLGHSSVSDRSHPQVSTVESPLTVTQATGQKKKKEEEEIILHLPGMDAS